MTRAYSLPASDTRTSIGAIFGTGTNGVYLERISKITKDMGEHDPSTGEMFLSIEWGSFDNKLSVLSNTKYDVEVNSASFNRGNQMFEKRVSGMFLGELLRLAVLEMHNDPEVALFPGIDQEGHSSSLYTRWAVDASILSVAEGGRLTRAQRATARSRNPLAFRPQQSHWWMRRPSKKSLTQ